jgi:hypothetical protein
LERYCPTCNADRPTTASGLLCKVCRCDVFDSRETVPPPQPEPDWDGAFDRYAARMAIDREFHEYMQENDFRRSH